MVKRSIEEKSTSFRPLAIRVLKIILFSCSLNNNEIGYKQCTHTHTRHRDSVSVPRAVVLRADHQTSALLRSPVNRLDNVNEFLLILQHPVELVVVTGAEIAHHVLVAEEEEDGAGVVQLVHGIEIGDLHLWSTRARPRLR